MPRNLMRLLALAMVIFLATLGLSMAAEINWKKMDEDVLVMKKLVSDTLRDAAGTAEGSPGWFGIDWAGVSSIGTNAAYLPGYGAIFVTRVGFPLTPPKKPAAEPSGKEHGRWEKARRQVIRTPPLPTLPTDAESYSYNERLVERTRKAILDLLANEAKNLTEVPGTERVTVFIYGPLAGPGGALWSGQTRFSLREGEREIPIVLPTTGAGLSSRSVLAISVKASELAAQREGKLSAKDLEQRIEVSQR